MPSSYVWNTSAELVDELLRLERQAGVPGCWQRARWAASGEGSYEAWRDRLRSGYFAVPDPALRCRMIDVAAELHRRERIDAGLQRLGARRALVAAQAREELRMLGTVIAGSLALTLAGDWVAGLPGAIGGVVLALLLAVALFRDRRRNCGEELERARQVLNASERRARDLERRAAPFDAGEEANGRQEARAPAWPPGRARTAWSARAQ